MRSFWWVHWELFVLQSRANCIQAIKRLNMMQSVRVQFKLRHSEIYLLYFKIIRGLLHKETSLSFIWSAKALCPLHMDEPFRQDMGFIPFHGGWPCFWINDGINHAIKCHSDFHLAWLGLVRQLTFCDLKSEFSQLWLFLGNVFREQVSVSMSSWIQWKNLMGRNIHFSFPLMQVSSRQQMPG